jgi:hypothetical protein
MAAVRPCHHRTPPPAGTRHVLARPSCSRQKPGHVVARRRVFSHVHLVSSPPPGVLPRVGARAAPVLPSDFIFQPRGRPHASRTRVIDRSSASTHFPSRDSIPCSACLPTTADRITADITSLHAVHLAYTPSPDRFLHCPNHDLHPQLKLFSTLPGVTGHHLTVARHARWRVGLH